MVVPARIDTTRKLYSFCVVNLGPTCLANGRSGESGAGIPGTVRTTSFERQQDAQKAEQSIIKRRLSHGYTPGAHRSSYRWYLSVLHQR
jgi:predicted DNA-binding WGR domain protein